jgi:uncharacterized RDD family membrane protein YckC
MSTSHDDAASAGPALPPWGPPSYGSDSPTYAIQRPSPAAACPPEAYPGNPYGASQSYPPIPGALAAGGYAPPPVWVPPVPTYPYTRWGRRVGAYLIDFAPVYLALIPFSVGYGMLTFRIMQLSSSAATTSEASTFRELLRPALAWLIVGVVLMLAAFGWLWYNRWLTAGRTGQSLGKRVLETKLVAEINGQPIGPVNAFLRDLLHVLDGAACIGYLWPLWDAKRQTFSDKIMKTVVTDRPTVGDPPSPGPAATAGYPYGQTA